MSPGRKGAPQLPSADADEARLYIGLLLRGKLYHHLQKGEIMFEWKKKSTCSS